MWHRPRKLNISSCYQHEVLLTDSLIASTQIKQTIYAHTWTHKQNTKRIIATVWREESLQFSLTQFTPCGHTGNLHAPQYYHPLTNRVRSNIQPSGPSAAVTNSFLPSQGRSQIEAKSHWIVSLWMRWAGCAQIESARNISHFPHSESNTVKGNLFRAAFLWALT